MNIRGNLGGISIGNDYDTFIMGIINLSPSSFFKGSVFREKQTLTRQITSMVKAGADCIDVGALSSAPRHVYNTGEKYSDKVEIERLKLFFDAVNEISEDIPISVDTKSSKTAEYALSKSATIINDISGFKFDPKLPSVIADHDASAVIMACKRVPGDVFKLNDIKLALRESIAIGEKAEVNTNKIVVDPGLGAWIPERNHFHDYYIIKHLKELAELNHCILVGISRKSFIGKVLGVPPNKRLWGSLSATTIAILNGAHVIRTHDVMETKHLALVTDYIMKKCKNED
ncbi:MAG: dihydropteroate synthase [Candidatus Hodarchaeales archaeon]